MILTTGDMNFFIKAATVSHSSDFGKTHVGCVAVYHGRVIGSGYNSEKTHPAQEKYNRFRNHDGKIQGCLPKLHAEISCLNSIRHMDLRMSKVKLYIFRSKKDGSFGMARPCPSCMAAITDLGIKDIFYTTDIGYAYERLKERGDRYLRNM